ncbi:MAG TPA: hypothetical protein EYQ81_14505 [Sneathiellales bacterium]|nr:hypothetical protein [Sneathiellales bacterium]
MFAILPTPFWYMLNVSTDLPLAIIVGAFWLFWVEARQQSPWRMAGVAVIVVIAGLSRPNAMSLLLFLWVDVLIWEVALKEQRQARRRGLLFFALITIIAILFAMFYLPYLQWVLHQSGSASYFGRLPAQYFRGLWPDLPELLNLGLSWLSLVAAKVLYLMGLRLSFGNTATPLVALRVIPGMIMLPGLIWLIFRADLRVRFFTFFFLVPILFGISQDRYVFPIQPVLFYYGIKGWREFAFFFKKIRYRST